MLDTMKRQIETRETIEQIECANVRPDLAKLAAAARSKGHLGFAVFASGGRLTPFVGAFIGYDGQPHGQTYAEHETPEAALVALGG